LKPTHIVIHTHRFGTSVHQIAYHGKPKHLTDEKIIEACDIDFESDMEESLEVIKIEKADAVIK